ncbi:MAG: amidohydrolase family protein [Salinirussus sp.]
MPYEGNLVVDAVSHVYHLGPSNLVGERGRDFVESTYHHTHLYQTEDYYMSEGQFFKEHDPEEVARVLFLESDVDFTIHHSLPIVDFFHDGMAGSQKGLDLRNNDPDRVAIYESINPLSDGAIDDVRRAANEYDADGLKLYPARYRNGEDLRVALNESTTRPILDEAVDQGINTVAVHKALPIGPTSTSYYKLDDVDDVADQYPELNFEIVHAGLAFLEETVYLMAKHPNVYANFEITGSLLMTQPRKFGRVLGEMLLWAGPDRILFASGCVLTHPQPIIEKFWDYQFPEELRSGYGYPELTDEIKRKILGENAIQMLGRDPAEIRSAVENDRWAERRASLDERPDAWSSISPTGERP